MLVLVAIAILLKRYGTQAIPLPVPTPTYSVFDTPIFARDNSSDGCHIRTVLDILWSCLATTFACTWVSAHPNVPFKGEGRWTLLGRRIFLMFFSILAPEFMIVWAFKQWRGAVMIREAVNEASRNAFPDPQDSRRNSWTTAHGHLLQMGGFRLSTTARENFYWGGSSNLGRRIEKPQTIEEDHTLFAYISGIQRRFDEIQVLQGEEKRTAEKGLLRTLIPEHLFFRRETSGGAWSHNYSRDIGPQDSILEGVLSIDALERLLCENLIRFPTITEDEISDRSKGDALSKGIALLQLTWFIVQIILRHAQGLAITELELTTAALAGLNSVMYIFWWSKPRDVRFPVVIRTKAVEELLVKRTEDTTWSFSDQKFDFREHLWTSMSTQIRKIGVFARHLYSSLCECHRYFPKKRVEHDEVNYVALRNPSGKAYNVSSHSSKLQQIYWALISVAKAVEYCFAFLLSVAAYVINFGLFVPILQTIDNDVSNSPLLPMVFDEDERVRELYMMFYSDDAGVQSLFSTASIAGALFGGVHCLAWHFSFPSHVEQIMWRTASLGIVGASALSFVGTYTTEYISDNDIDELDGVLRKIGYGVFFILWIILLFLTVAVYPVFRLMLLVLAVTSLRSLPSSAFDTVQWIEFVPHI